MTNLRSLFKKPKVTIIGRGTGGSISAAHYACLTDWKVEWIYDPGTQAQAVGEGGQLNLIEFLKNTVGFTYRDFPKIDANFKTGIDYINWGKQDYFHHYVPPVTSMHFSAVKLQEFIHERIKDRVSIREERVEHSDLDSDVIIDCGGKPKEYDHCYTAEFIPVNSVYVTQCFWDAPKLTHTLAIARPYGWVFGVPLPHRIAIGYVYNNEINSLEQVQEDVKTVFDEYGLTPSDTTAAFSYRNYYRKQNFFSEQGRTIVYNGNASFFLEPMEATSIHAMEDINRQTYDVHLGNKTIDDANREYLEFQRECQHIIAMHYYAGSRWDTEFWQHAQTLGKHAMQDAAQHPRWHEFVAPVHINNYIPDRPIRVYGGGWQHRSFRENLVPLGISDDVLAMIAQNTAHSQ